MKRQTNYYYQFPNGKVKRITKEAGFWYYDNQDGVTIGSDTLLGAKMDIEQSGGKLWKRTLERSIVLLRA